VGLASFNTSRRVKEIGIRKALGASSRDVVKLLVGQFLRPVLIANVIAWPLAWVAMRQWLAGFSDRIALAAVLRRGFAAGAGHCPDHRDCPVAARGAGHPGLGAAS
jgi:predicted lysophospholipase L1 biosynthesis ABC-type transport system permease subunit